MNTDSLIRAMQEGLLDSVQEQLVLRDIQLSPRVADALRDVPRHAFVERYRFWGSRHWNRVGTDADDLASHLPALYRDDGLAIAGFEGDEQLSTISRPTVVLLMLELLSIRPGDRIFEVGTGSGWNAALMGALTGPNGYVESVEIISELALQAERAVQRLGLSNVHILNADAASLPGSPQSFDRVIFTTGTYDIPPQIFERLRIGGLCLMVLKFAGGGDAVILFRRRADHLESVSAHAYDFVTMSGTGHRRQYDPLLLGEFGPWQELQHLRVSSRPFPCGGSGRASLASRTFAMRTFLEIKEPKMCWFVEPDGWPFYFFGLWDEQKKSLALVRENELTSYGSAAAANALLARVHEWCEFGFPSATTMRVCAYPAGQAPPISAGQILLARESTDFVWSESVSNAE